MTMQVSRWLIATGTIAALLSGCGTQGMPNTAVRASAVSEAQATKTLKDGFKKVYGAAFSKCDANQDKAIDEYEASPYIDLRDFVRADENKDGKLSNVEFMNYATRGGLFGLFHQTQDGFFSGQRRSILKGFDKLDTNHDKLLAPAELNDAATAGSKMTLTIPGLKTTVKLAKFTDEAFKAADHTGDGKLGQAEFEDYCIDQYSSALNPGAAPAPAPAPGEDPAPAPAPAS